jgi:hypothetical protein
LLAIPTATLGQSAEASPSAQASGAPAVPPAAGPGGVGLGADQFVLADDFDDGTLWVTGEDERGSVSYEAGQLAIDLAAQDSSLWSWRRLDRTWPVLSASGSVASDSADGLAGWMCGTAEPSYLVGIVGRESWMLGVTGAQSALLDSGALPEGVVPDASGTHQVTLDCATTPDGSRAQLWIGDTLLGDATSTLAGPWDRVGAYADVGAPPSHTRFDQLVVMGGEGTSVPSAAPSPAPSPAGG